jgi:5-oxoprolinase (ATP-hydrolysing) subunit C
MSGNGSVEIIETSFLNTVQDLGRPGLRKFGVGSAGAMDGFALAAANLMVGNPAGAAGIEVTTFPFRFRISTARRIAATGAAARLIVNGCALPPWWSVRVDVDTEVRLEAPRHGMRSYIAVTGGIAVAEVLGSRSTDIKAGFGGPDGRMLERGQNLPLGPAGPDLSAGPDSFGILPPEKRIPMSPPCDVSEGTTVVRVLPAAEHDDLTDEARKAFWGLEWQVSTSSNRVGYRLVGPALRLQRPMELLSH